MKLTGFVVHLFEKTTSTLSDAVLKRCIPINQNWLYPVALKSINEVALKLKALVHDQKAWASKRSQPAFQERRPNQSCSSAMGIHHSEGAVERSHARHIEDGVFIFVVVTIDKQQIHAHHNVEVVGAWCG